MKVILIIILLMFSIMAFCQTKDTVVVKAYEKTDTIPARIMYADDKDRVFVTDGFIIRRGFAREGTGGWYWIEKPEAAGALDKNRKPIKKPIQVL